MLITTLANALKKARSTNAADSSFPSRIPTTTEPTGGGVQNIAGTNEIQTCNQLLIIPYGIGSDNNTFSLRLIGWKAIAGTDLTTLWVPITLSEIACTLCTAVGIASTPVLNTERFVDTITITTGNSGVDISVVSPTGNVIGFALADLKGCAKVELSFSTGGSATSCNALISQM
jgi:hypothetical protein